MRCIIDAEAHSRESRLRDLNPVLARVYSREVRREKPKPYELKKARAVPAAYVEDSRGRTVELDRSECRDVRAVDRERLKENFRIRE